MSQQLIPINGGVETVNTTPQASNLKVLSPQYIRAKNLTSRPTEWVIDGRPIYRRLPSASEVYQIDFFNVVPAEDAGIGLTTQDIGYVYVPWGQGTEQGSSLYASVSDSKQDILLQGGKIIWKYGSTNVLPAIINLEVLDVAPTRYDLTYQLLFDDAPVEKLYQVNDFQLIGLPLTISSSSDAVIGWRYPAVNAFLSTTTQFWANQDTYFPSYAQPTQSYIQWESDLPMAYSKVTLRCPANTAYTGEATFGYYMDSTFVEIQTSSIQSDTDGQFFEFTVSPNFQTGWKVEFSSLDVSIQSITVTGVVTLSENPASPSSKAILVMYPSGTLPKTVNTVSGETVPTVYCQIATIDVSTELKITEIEDKRFIIRRDYTPIADWLTRPFDEDLINLYEQVSNFAELWMSPQLSMKQEYVALSENQITVEM